MSTLPRFALAVLLALSGCECGGGSGLPSALDQYRQTCEITPFHEWSVPGLRLYRVVEVGVQDRSWASIVGVDEQGALVEGAALFLRMRELPPNELAARASVVLLGGNGPIQPGDPGAGMWMHEDADAVQAPHVDGRHLVYDVLEGDMAPRVARVTIDLDSGEIISREGLLQILHPPPPPDPIRDAREALHSGSGITQEIQLNNLANHPIPEVADDIVSCLSFPGDTVRVAAARALGALGDASRAQVLIAAMSSDSSRDVRLAAAEALLRLPSPEGVAAVRARPASIGDAEERGRLYELLRFYESRQR